VEDTAARNVIYPL